MFPEIKFKIVLTKEATEAWTSEQEALLEHFCHQDDVLAGMQKLEAWLACAWDKKMRVMECHDVFGAHLEQTMADSSVGDGSLSIENVRETNIATPEPVNIANVSDAHGGEEGHTSQDGGDVLSVFDDDDDLPAPVQKALVQTPKQAYEDQQAQSHGGEENNESSQYQICLASSDEIVHLPQESVVTASIRTIENHLPLDTEVVLTDAQSVILNTSESPPDMLPLFKKTHTPTITQAYRVVLPNAKQGEAYAKPLQFEPDVAYVVREIEFSPECGLSWNADTLQCEGVPDISGDVLVKIWWHPLESEQHELSQTQIYINADPKSLWKNIPSDSQTLFWKEDEASLGLDGDQYHLLAARVRGRSHAHVGSCCDDDFAMARFVINEAYPAYVVTVSDGAGSAAFSRLGSKLAVDAVVKSLSETLQSPTSIDYIQKQLQNDVSDESWQEYVEQRLSRAAYKAFEAQYHAFKDEHPEIISDIKQLSSTLLMGFGIALPNQKTLVGAYWIGDGVVALYQPNAKVDVMGEADSGEFSGQTRFLSKDDVIDHDSLIARIQYRVLEGEHALILMTDGVSDPKFDSEQAMSELQPWQTLWHEWQEACRDASNASEAAAALQAWLNFFSPGNHDDRTLAIVSAPWYPHNETVAT